MTNSISNIEWLRLLLVYTHLLLSMLALARVLTADVGLVTGKLSRQALRSTVQSIVWFLCGLWISGLSIIWLDTGFDPSTLAERPKLLFKLVSVSVLTGNGLLLHRLAFPVLLSNAPMNLRTSILIGITGSLSTLHWLLAAFIGVSRPLDRLPIQVLLQSYVLLCSVVVIISIACLGLLRRQVLQWRNTNAAASHIDYVVS